jgi:alcohol dehydrogenase
MRAAIFRGKGKIAVGQRPDPKILESTDVIVRVVYGCVCGSDLWYYRGINPHKVGSIGHEFIGVVDKAGKGVDNLKKGDFVVAPFQYSDGTCINCKAGVPTSCLHGGGFGNGDSDGGQGEYVRVPFANYTLVKVPGKNHTHEILKSLTALSDVMCTGYHSAVSAGVKKGQTVAVIGDGAVGLCAIIGANRLGAKRIIALSRNPARQKLAKEFGATDIVEERGDEAMKTVLKLVNNVGVDGVLECVGTNESMKTAADIARPGSTIGVVGHPAHVEVPFPEIFFKNVTIKGGIAPARLYIPMLMQDVLSGKINPGLVFDYETDLDHIKEAYDAMDQRRAVKSLLLIGEE